jgi:hypothetical protein
MGDNKKKNLLALLSQKSHTQKHTPMRQKARSTPNNNNNNANKKEQIEQYSERERARFCKNDSS